MSADRGLETLVSAHRKLGGVGEFCALMIWPLRVQKSDISQSPLPFRVQLTQGFQSDT